MLKRYDTLVPTSGESLISGSDDHPHFLRSSLPSWTTSTEASEVPAGMGGKLMPLTRMMDHQSQVAHAAFSPDQRWDVCAVVG